MPVSFLVLYLACTVRFKPSSVAVGKIFVRATTPQRDHHR